MNDVKKAGVGVAMLGVVLVGALQLGNRTAAAQDATICHKPGTPAEQTMVVPSAALQGHLGHGDYLGTCMPTPPTTPPPGL